MMRWCEVICLGLILTIVASLDLVKAETPEQQATAWLGEIYLPEKNYVEDGSFENGGEGWGWFEHKAGAIVDQVAMGGKHSFRMGLNDPGRHFYYNQSGVPLETGKTYTLSARVKAEGASKWGADQMSSGAIFLTDYGWTKSIALKPPGATFDWTLLTQTFVAMPTKPRADGKPSYTLTVYWPPKNEGQFWLDEIQIEEGSHATPYSDAYVGDAITALEKLRGLAREIFSTRSALAKMKKGTLVVEISRELEGILAEAQTIRDDLKRFEQCSKSDCKSLAKRIDAAMTKLAGLKTLIWTGPAHITLNEVQMPAKRGARAALDLICLKGEHRDVALNMANLTSTGYPARLAVSELYNKTDAYRVQPSQWIKIYSVPLMRGFTKPSEVFTDALPEVDKGGIIQVNPATVSQAVLSIDTSGLLPGEYTGNITVISLVDAAGKTEIPVKIKVLPMALLPLKNVEIAECYGHTDYAWEAMVQLGVNAFVIDASWIDAEFNEDGTLKKVDFTRVDPGIKRALTDVPEAHFHCLSGRTIFDRLTGRYGWKPEEPRFKTAYKAWVQALADHLATLSVEPSRLVIETYDEPSEGDYATGTNMANWIHEVNPAIRTWFYSTGISQDEGWKKNVLAHDIVGPLVELCTPANMAYAKTLGKTLWVYDCAADGESFEPIAYYRLMPWTCRKYGITGWGHFSWFNSSHGYERGYRPWEGVETQNLVYPGPGGEGFVISRQFLAIRAGHEDYQVLDALDRAMADPKADRQKIAMAKKFLSTIYDKALSLSPREKFYQTHIEPGVSPDLLDQLRQDAVKRIATLLPSPSNLETSLEEREGKTILAVSVPEGGKLTIRYLADGKLPWIVREQNASMGKGSVELDAKGVINRCLVEWCGKDGSIKTGSPLIIPQITVDSTSNPYDSKNLNDGIRVESVKFEPEVAWASQATPTEHWVQMDLGQQRSISKVNLFWMTYTGLPKKTMVQYAEGNGDWKPVSATPKFRPAAAPVEVIDFTPVTTSKLRVLMAPNGGGPGGPSLMGLSEVEVR